MSLPNANADAMHSAEEHFREAMLAMLNVSPLPYEKLQQVVQMAQWAQTGKKLAMDDAANDDEMIQRNAGSGI